MADDQYQPQTQDLQPPQDTVSGGTPVMSATTTSGDTWSYDNDSGKWVNLQTGVSQTHPPDDETGSLSAAERTHALADEMRKAEAEITAGTYKPATPTPAQRVAFSTPPQSAAITPPTTQTGTQAPPMAAPITPPQGPGMQAPIAPPTIDPAEQQRLMAQRPVPGTRTPPSAAAIQFYNMQAYQRAIQMGMPQKQAASIYLPGMLQGQAASPKPNWVPADPNTGAPGHFETSKGTIHVPPQIKPAPVIKPTGKLSEVEHAELTSGLSELNSDERDARKTLTAARTAQDYEAAGKALDELKKIQADRKKLIGKFSAKASPETTPPNPGVVKPAALSYKGSPAVGAVVKGYRFKGGDPSKKENWEKVE